MSNRFVVWLGLAALGWSGCNESGIADVAAGTSATDPSGTGASASDVAATGLDITKIALYQAIEVTLTQDGAAPTTMQAPIIQDRDALLRIFVTPHEGWEERKIDAVVTFSGSDGDEVLTVTKNVVKESAQDTLVSTLNVDVPGELLTRDTTIGVELVENDGVAREAGEGVVTWSTDEVGGLAVEVTDQLDVVVIPVAYHYDGSGRLPDTSEAQLQGIQELMYGMYPATDVTVTVGETLDWYREITAFTGWDNLLYAVNELRDDANVSPNTYYYAMFRPTEGFNAFCQTGCILGLSFVGYSANDPWYRASMGIGYTGEISIETAPHELGHAHGREHAPCGLYGQPSDPQYPHDNANLGVWGYDLVDAELIAPGEGKDVMSYCTPMWISDYTYYNLFERIQDVGRQNRSVTSTWRVMQVTSDGRIVPGDTVQLAGPSGEPHEVTLLDGIGRGLGTTTGWFVPFDHLPGGVMMVPETDGLYTIEAGDLLETLR